MISLHGFAKCGFVGEQAAESEAKTFYNACCNVEMLWINY